jgi:anti-sigma B factor antagonist
LLGGEFDMAVAARVEDELASLRRSSPRELVVDLSDVTFLDSTGLHVLVRLHAAAQEERFQLSIVRGGDAVERVFEVTGLDSVLPLVDGVPDNAS